ncbi:hypothetical protein [Dyella japonica]|uniref:hypothetical protein n=1 Tax=Dyella japonica TaxID=231455 RepID=UPI0011857CA7|nr:hypothetical protein [Dyella japonica]
MRKFYTLSHSESIALGCFNSSDDEVPIWVGSPFFGLPSSEVDCFRPPAPLNCLLLLDVNILGAIRARKNVTNVRSLFAWAASQGLEVTPIVAVAEQHRTHGAPDKAFRHYVDVLRTDYLYDLPTQEVDRLLGVFKEFSPAVADNVNFIANYFVLIKHFYNKRWSVDRKVKEFAELVRERNVPVLAFAFLLGCVYFYVRDNPGQFPPAIVSKVQSDMCVYADKKKERVHLRNLASDLMLLSAPAEIFFNHETSEFNFCYVASGDVSIGLALTEIAYTQVVVNDKRCFGSLGFRPSGTVSDVLEAAVTKYLRQSSQQSFSFKGRGDGRFDNLERLAEEMLSGHP